MEKLLSFLTIVGFIFGMTTCGVKSCSWALKKIDKAEETTKPVEVKEKKCERHFKILCEGKDE